MTVKEVAINQLMAMLIGVLLRCCVSLHPYSGQSQRTGPMFGDYEAQRHWMEITRNLPVNEWYFNTSNNDLNYWGLDYPPLTAYHSLFCGYILDYYEPASVALHTSRGYESYSHKLFMRYSVLAVDLLIYIPAVVYFLSAIYSNVKNKQNFLSQCTKNNISITFALCVCLFYPGIILIDYGHFQYNVVSLGFMIGSVAALLHNRELLGTFLFCLSLNYKQMELYHSLPFFCYLLGLCVWPNGPSPTEKVVINVKKLSMISLVVITTFLFIWFPFLSSLDSVFQVIHRLFPIARGAFEDKVANFWCSLSNVYKLHNILTRPAMASLCLITTLISVLPSAIDLFFHPNLNKFLLSLINCSLGFFLFSYQVHEKSILLVAAPVMLYFPMLPFPCFWFLMISVFSMLPLFMKDNLQIAYISLAVFYYIVGTKVVRYEYLRYPVVTPKTEKARINEVFVSRAVIIDLLRHFNLRCDLFPRLDHDLDLHYSHFFARMTFNLSMFFSLIVSFVFMLSQPPPRYPDLFSVIVSCFSFLHFFAFFVYFNFKQHIGQFHI